MGLFDLFLLFLAALGVLLIVLAVRRTRGKDDTAAIDQKLARAEAVFEQAKLAFERAKDGVAAAGGATSWFGRLWIAIFGPKQPPKP